MKVYIGSDHAGFELKSILHAYLREQAIDAEDCGTYHNSSVDYPDFAHKVSQAVLSAPGSCGILICGSGNGVCIAANRHKGIRAALCWEPEIASLAKQHNNANIICLPARFISPENAIAIWQAYMGKEFEGGRHEIRVVKIDLY